MAKTTKRRRIKSTEGAPPDYQNVLSKIKSVSDIQQFLKTMIIGPTGSGKTTTIATFPKPILILDFREQGTDSISDFGDDIKLLPVEHVDEVEQLYWYLLEGDHPYKTVAWENVAQAQDLFVIKAKEDEGKTADDHASKGTWGAAAGLFKTWLMNYRDLPLHIIFTSHPRTTTPDEEEDAGGIVPEVGPRVMPSVAGILEGAVNIIGQTFIREATSRGSDGKLNRKIQYAMRLGPHPYYKTKIRKPKDRGITPEFIVDPTFDKLIQITRGEWTDDKAKPKKKKGVKNNAKED